MSSLVIILLLGIISLFILLYPLWQRRADKTLGTGIETDDLAVQWEVEKDRLVKEQHDLDVDLAEGRISQETHASERRHVVEDAKRALDRLRQARRFDDQILASSRHKPRSYPKFGAAFASMILIATVGLTFHLKSLDVKRPTQQTDLQRIEAMVSSLEEKVKAGQGSLNDKLMLARSFLVMGRKDQSIALYQHIHETNTTNMTAIMALGEIFLNSKDKAQQKQALGYFNKALKIEPKNPNALWFKSLSLVRERKLVEAKDVLNELKIAAKDNKKAQDAVSVLIKEINKNLDNNKPKVQKQDQPGENKEPLIRE